LRGRQLEHAKFRRQQPLGRFIVDFFCEAARLVVEVDGGRHDDPSVAARDADRDALLRAAGLTVLRLLLRAHALSPEAPAGQAPVPAGERSPPRRAGPRARAPGRRRSRRSRASRRRPGTHRPRRGS
ncbi:MAG: DUF559 domain-containing protein, partial [Polyangiaceae bacterium]|nr:DUF559 domain-containing protein [Polyangiaceae bacterium]